MFKVADYLIQAQSSDEVEGHATLKPLDTRGGRSAAYSAWMMLTAIYKIVGGKATGGLRGVHVNMAERLSLFRKGIIIFVCRSLGIPVILHLHAAQLHHFYKGLPRGLQWMTRWFFSMANHCIVLGHAASAFVINELKVPPDKVSIVINGVPTASVPRRTRVPGTPYKILFLGNLSERKGVSDLLAAVSKLGFPQEQLIVSMAGGGDIETYTAKASSLGISSIVRFEGWSDQDKAARLLAEADVLILPSYDEGLPLVILEALANGVAVICTPVGEIPSVLTDGLNALFVMPGDIDGIAKGIANIIDDVELRVRLENNGKAIYDSQFSISQFFSGVSRIHQSIFAISARGRDAFNKSA